MNAMCNAGVHLPPKNGDESSTNKKCSYLSHQESVLMKHLVSL